MSSYDTWLTTPPEDSPFCDICGGNYETDECVCPECPECGDYGNPSCYDVTSKYCHGLVKSQKQIDSKNKNDAYWEEQNRLESEYMKSYLEDSIYED